MTLIWLNFSPRKGTTEDPVEESTFGAFQQLFSFGNCGRGPLNGTRDLHTLQPHGPGANTMGLDFKPRFQRLTEPLTHLHSGLVPTVAKSSPCRNVRKFLPLWKYKQGLYAPR